MKRLIIALILAAPAMANAAAPLWLRDAKISPNGETIAFTYKGDIWTVPSAGGEATRLTATEWYETTPIWSPDSKKIAFAGDRHGNFDIYLVDAKGGSPTRLTVNSAAETPESFSPDGKSVIFSASIQDPAESALFPTARMSELYSIPTGGGAMTRILATPAQMICWLPSGEAFLYQDQKGFENEWRKHHTSSVTRDIWMYDAATGKHTNLTNRGGEDRNPAVVGDEFYFLSERNGGSMNVYRAPIADPDLAKPVTKFKTHPVRFLSAANNGTLCYGYDGEIYTQKPGGKPAKVNIELKDEDAPSTVKMAISGVTEMAASPDGKSVAFIARGDVFVTSAEYSTTKQITFTPEAEKHLSWGHDSKSLIYTSERDGIYNVWQATMGRDDDPNFANATVINEEPLFDVDKTERCMAQMSPDGKKLAFVVDRSKIAVMDMKTKKVKMLTDGSQFPQRDADFNYTWSPDSRWIALEIVARKHDPYYDIAILNVATGEMTNLTNTGYMTHSPRWAMDGNALIFASEQYGMRNHASWGSMDDVLIAFMNREAMDEFKLSKEDKEISDDAKDKAKKDKKKDSADDTKKDESKDDDEEDDGEAIVVELDGITDRIMRLTPLSSNLLDAVVTADGETLYFITAGDEDNTLWSLNLREGDLSTVRNISDGYTHFDTTTDGKGMFLFGSKMAKFSPTTEKVTPITYSGTMRIDPVAERAYMFDHVVREERERFYDKKMHGVDWKALTDHYRRFLPYINNNYDYAEMLSELLGELNVSHTGASYRPATSSQAERTASLGLFYDFSYDGQGLKIAEVIAGGPLDKAASKVRPGMIVEKINGTTLTPTDDYSTLLTDIAGRKTLVSFYDPATDERFDEVVRPISAGAENTLLYERWIKARAAEVDSLSGGRLGYVHIQSMGDGSFREVYSQVLGKYNDREGIVIDIRWNGGGRLHEDIEVLFSGEKYLTQTVRGVETCDMPSRRWNKPSIMVMGEACYSNAHGTPWVYNKRGIGKLVGMPVAGTMTSVNWVNLQDRSLTFGIPVVGYRTAEGTYLENSQLEPDIRVACEPEVIVQGEDQQLKAAVEALLNQIDGK